MNIYLASSGIGGISDLVVGQPEFLAGLDKLLRERSLDDWKVYLRWHLLHSSAPFLNDAAETENFAFYGTILSGQPEQEPRWQRAARVIDGSIGEALGQLYVEKNFPPAARARMNELVENLKAVFRGPPWQGGLDDRGHPLQGAGQVRPLHAKRSATPTSFAIIPPSPSAPTIISATSCGRMCLKPGASLPVSASLWTARNGT